MVKMEHLLQEGHLTSVVGECLGVGADLSICDRSAALPLSHPHQRSSAGAQLSPLCLQQQQLRRAPIGLEHMLARGPAVQGGLKGKVAGHI